MFCDHTKQLEEIFKLLQEIKQYMSDPISPLNVALANIQTDLTALQEDQGQILTLLQSLQAAQQAGSLTLTPAQVTELNTAVSNAQGIDAALQALAAADVAALAPAASSTTTPPSGGSTPSTPSGASSPAPTSQSLRPAKS